MSETRCWKRFDVRLSVGEIDTLIQKLNEEFQYADHKNIDISPELIRVYDKLVWRRHMRTERKRQCG